MTRFILTGHFDQALLSQFYHSPSQQQFSFGHQVHLLLLQIRHILLLLLKYHILTCMLLVYVPYGPIYLTHLAFYSPASTTSADTVFSMFHTPHIWVLECTLCTKRYSLPTSLHGDRVAHSSKLGVTFLKSNSHNLLCKHH